MDKVTFGRNLYRVRRERKMTSQQLAEQIGISPAYLRQIESGVRAPSITVLIDICNALCVSPDFLLSGDLGWSNLEQIGALEAEIRRLPERDQKILAELIALVERADA